MTMSLREAREAMNASKAIAERPVKAIPRIVEAAPPSAISEVAEVPAPLREDLVMSPFRWEMHDDPDMLSAGYAKYLLWGHNLEDESILVIIKDHAISLYFVFPKSFKGDDAAVWDVDDARAVNSTLAGCMGDNAGNVIPFEADDFCYRRTLYFFDKPKPMCRVSFRNADSARHAGNIMKKGIFLSSQKGERVHGEVLLQEIGSILKLMTAMNTVYCGWLKCRARLITDPLSKLSSLAKEYVVRYSTVRPDGSIEKVPRPMWCSYDIETYSHNHNAFPCKVLAQDPCYLITLVFFRDGSSKRSWKSVAILMGDCIVEDEKISERIAGKSDDGIGEYAPVEVIKVTDEKDLLDEFTRQIMRGDPDLLTGYNILGYDNDFLNCRYSIRGIKVWPITGRLLGNVRAMKEPTQWESKASAGNKFYFPWSPGRTYVDLYGYAKKTYSLVTYSLANLAIKIFPKDEDMRKKDVPYKAQFECYARNMAALERRRNDPGVDISDELKEMGKVVVYCFYDSYLVAGIISKIHWWINIRETCNATACQPEDLFTRGAQMKVDALLYITAMEMGVIVDKRETISFGYKGGAVQHPVVGVTLDVVIGDFQSLYPNIIISHNLCYSTLLRPDEYNRYSDLKQFQAIVPICDDEDEEEDDDYFTPKKGKKKEKKAPVYRDEDFRFAAESELKGVLPTMLDKLLKKRVEVRAIKTDDPVLKIVYFGRQMALKVQANAGYGFTGVRRNKGIRPCLEIAATTTTIGRASIGKGIDWVLATYNCKLIYGDTDSFMITLPPGIPKEGMWKAGKDIMARASEQFEGLIFEFEGKYNLLCIKHKMYVKETFQKPGEDGVFTNLLVLDENGDPELEIKGLAPARRDNCQWVRDHLRVVLQMILARKSFADIVAFCTLSVVNLYNGKVALKDLVLSKGYKSGYKSETAPMKIFAAEMAKREQVILPGERHEYLVVHIPGEKKVAKRMILLSLYLTISEASRPMIDYRYYFENLVMDKTDVLIGAAFAAHSERISRWVMEYKGRVVDGRTPMLLLQKSTKLGIPVREYVKNLVALGL